MRFTALFLLFQLVALFSFGQELRNLQELISRNNYNAAKIKIDSFFNKGSVEDPRLWYYKGSIYLALATKSEGGNASLQNEAFDAFQRYQQMDPSNKMMTLEENRGLFQLYDLYYNQGVSAYNKQNYEEAFSNLKQALKVSDYVGRKGFSYDGYKFPVLDTQVVHLTASAGYMANRHEECLPYFEKLAKAKLRDKRFKEVYGFIAEHYAKKGDLSRLAQYVSLGKELYPGEDDYWISIELGSAQDASKRLARYEELLQKYPRNQKLAQDYVTELYNFTYTGERRTQDYASSQQRLQKALTNLLKMKSTAQANYVMALHVYRQIYDLDEAAMSIKGEGPADIGRKKELLQKQKEKYEELFPYALKSYTLYMQDKELSIEEKANVRRLLNLLIDYHQRKGQQEKVVQYTEKLKGF